MRGGGFFLSLVTGLGCGSCRDQVRGLDASGNSAFRIAFALSADFGRLGPWLSIRIAIF